MGECVLLGHFLLSQHGSFVCKPLERHKRVSLSLRELVQADFQQKFRLENMKRKMGLTQVPLQLASGSFILSRCLNIWDAGSRSFTTPQSREHHAQEQGEELLYMQFWGTTMLAIADPLREVIRQAWACLPKSACVNAS